MIPESKKPKVQALLQEHGIRHLWEMVEDKIISRPEKVRELAVIFKYALNEYVDRMEDDLEKGTESTELERRSVSNSPVDNVPEDEDQISISADSSEGRIFMDGENIGCLEDHSGEEADYQQEPEGRDLSKECTYSLGLFDPYESVDFGREAESYMQIGNIESAYKSFVKSVESNARNYVSHCMLAYIFLGFDVGNAKDAWFSIRCGIGFQPEIDQRDFAMYNTLKAFVLKTIPNYEIMRDGQGRFSALESVSDSYEDQVTLKESLSREMDGLLFGTDH